jgi:hypothetical protein
VRVPRCEILLPSSGARGTIRAGNFSQIPNVLQSGGDEGMWTFERYHRWMQQVGEWVRPATDASSYVAEDPSTALGGLSYRPGSRSAGSAVPAGVQAAARGGRPDAARSPLGSAAASGGLVLPGGRAPMPAPVDDVIEIAGDDLDLAGLAELAKKIGERKP